MVSFKEMDEVNKKKLMGMWKDMSETDKTHFVNQVAIVLSVIGNEKTGKKEIVDVIISLIKDGSKTLADFGIYLPVGFKKIEKKHRRAIKIVDNYRMK